MIKLFKAESALSLLVAVSVFSLLYLSYSSWQAWQNRQTNFVFQQQQALQIAENQLALMMDDTLACESRLDQNGIRFEVSCTLQHIEVRFPTGRLIIKRSS